MTMTDPMQQFREALDRYHTASYYHAERDLQNARAAIESLYRAALAGQGEVKVPDEQEPFIDSGSADIAFVRGWNACRAEVLRLNALAPPGREGG